jgi:hypothetical protein
MSLVIAAPMADSQILDMAAAAFTQGPDVLKRRFRRNNVLATHPARHHTMQLPGNGLVDFVAGNVQSAHGGGVF